MKWLWMLLALVLGAIAGTTWLADPGYVLIRLDGWLVETSAAVAVLVLVGAIAVLTIAWQFLRQVLHSTGKLAAWQHNKTHKARLELLQQALVAVLNRSWGQAGKALSRMDAEPVDSDGADINTQHHQFTQLMLTAFAAHARGDVNARDDAIRQIQQLEAAPTNLPQGRETLFVQWHLEAGEVAQALAKLKPLLAKNNTDPRLLSLSVTAHVAQGDWLAADKNWQNLKKAGRPLATGLRLHAYEFQRQDGFENPVLSDSTTLAEVLSRSADGIKEYKALSVQDQANTELLGAWAHALLQQQRKTDALTLLAVALDSSWSEILLTQWLKLADEAPKDSLLQAQGWAKNRPNDPRLLEGLGQLAGKNGQWQDAKDYFETALKAFSTKDPDKARIYQHLGGVWHALGDEHRALQYFTQAQSLATH